MNIKRAFTISKLTMIFFLTFLIISCNSENKTTMETDNKTEETKADFEISLAQWSLHKSFRAGDLDPDDFPSIAAGYGVDVIELVNTFYLSKVTDMDYWTAFKKKCDDAGVKVGLIMCDGLGDLGNSDAEARQKAVENHYQWVDIAKMLGAHTVRVNAAGQGTAEEVAANAVDGLSKLGEYGASKGINIVVENHGGYSSDGSWLAGVMKEVGKDNVGTLPDFGNFCIERGPDNTCAKEYDKYKGMAELMPYAKGVSAKSNNFDADGNEPDIDFERIMKIVKDSGFKGHVGIEYEGSKLSEDEGIKKTKALLEKIIATL